MSVKFQNSAGFLLEIQNIRKYQNPTTQNIAPGCGFKGTGGQLFYGEKVMIVSSTMEDQDLSLLDTPSVISDCLSKPYFFITKKKKKHCNLRNPLLPERIINSFIFNNY